jgi:hypothetical protein
MQILQVVNTGLRSHIGPANERRGSRLALWQEPTSVASTGCEWHDLRYAGPAIFENLELPMGEVVRFVPKSELERARLVREARANYERVFPSADQTSERQSPKE